MSNLNVAQRKFVVKAGMSVEDVIRSKDATALQKKYAYVFDTDGIKGFSQEEADLFNSTSISEKEDGSVVFWTIQKDGTKKGKRFDSKDKNIQYKPCETAQKTSASHKNGDNFFAGLARRAGWNGAADFLREDWSGKQIARWTGDNVVTDWLQDKDKVCTDGKDDGKLTLKDGYVNYITGVYGGLPKAIVNHPVGTITAYGASAISTVATDGAALPVLGAIGVVGGVATTVGGTYELVTAKNDREAKLGAERLGTGVTATILAIVSSGPILERAANSGGVKSAEISADADPFTKTVQMFKSIPEALSMSGKNFKSGIGQLTPASTMTTVERATRVSQNNLNLDGLSVKESTNGNYLLSDGSRIILRHNSIEYFSANGDYSLYHTNVPYQNLNSFNAIKAAQKTLVETFDPYIIQKLGYRPVIPNSSVKYDANGIITEQNPAYNGILKYDVNLGKYINDGGSTAITPKQSGFHKEEWPDLFTSKKQ